MTFNFEISPELRKILDKLERKNRNLAIAINKKSNKLSLVTMPLFNISRISEETSVIIRKSILGVLF